MRTAEIYTLEVATAEERTTVGETEFKAGEGDGEKMGEEF